MNSAQVLRITSHLCNLEGADKGLLWQQKLDFFIRKCNYNIEQRFLTFLQSGSLVTVK